ncbi:PucR family transcriptional regulator ligand-binding domain-containing protein [Wukongibacter baidiensis]|uniref:PucR family transcriptional regulator n=1 Tax=Wukongibacter baidiensis TaxID=1723361 RepID=UPI003D7FDEDB
MALKLTKALQLKCFERIEVVAGKETVKKKNVTGITIVEAPDIANWIKGGELLLTSLYNFHSDFEKQREMVAKLAEKGASGLIVKISRVTKEIPQVIIEEGNRNGLPILQLPEDVKYIDIMYPVMSELFNRQLTILEHYKNCHNQFIDLALNDGNLKAIALKLAGIIKHPVIIFNQELKMLASSDEKYNKIIRTPKNLSELQADTNLKLYRQLIRFEREELEFEETFVTTPVTVLNYIKAYIAVAEMDRSLNELDFVALETSVSNLSLVLVKERAIKEIKYRFRNDIIDDIINARYSSEDDITQRAKTVGWDLNKPHVMILVQLQNPLEDNNVLRIKESISRILMVIDSTAYHYSQSMIIISKADRFLILFPSHGVLPESIKRFADELYQNIKMQIKNIAVTIGIGTEANHIADISRSYREACDAISFGQMVYGDGSVIQYNDLGVNRLLCQYKDLEDLKKFIPPTLMKLSKYDIEKNNDLIKTLMVYLNNNANAKRTADELYIHYKTVQYRINRIKEIMGINFEDREFRLDIEMGLRILTLLEKK